MRPRTVLVLLIVVVALLAFIWLYERELPTSDERAELEKRLVRVDSNEVTALEIIHGDERVVLEQVAPDEERAQGESEWRIVEPLTARADEDQVENLVDSLTTLDKRRTLDEVAYADAGLEQPRARIRVVSAETEIELLIGAQIPASSSMIVALSGSDEKHVVEDSIWSAVDRAPGEWRSRDVFVGKRDDIDRISLRYAEQTLLLAKRVEEFWLESPITDRADKTQVEDLLADLTGLQVSEFVDEPDESETDYGVDPPVAEVEIVTTGQADPFRLLWGNAVPEQEGHYYATADGQLFTTEADLMDALSRSAEEWRSRAITSLETYQIDWIEVSQQGQDDLRLERAGADWKRNEDAIAFTSVSDFLYAVTGADAGDMESPEELRSRGVKLGDPMLELTLGGAEREEVVAFYEAVSDGVPVTVDNREVVLRLEAKEIDEILAKLAQVRSAQSKNAPVPNEQEGNGAELSIDQDS